MPYREQREYIFFQLGYKPTEEQDKVHDSPARTKLVLGGERGGKSKLSAEELLSRFFEGNLYWLVAADYAQTRAEYDYICEGLSKLGLPYDATKQVDPGEILTAGDKRIITKSARDPRKLGMEAPDGILACEAGQLDYLTYLRLRGRLAEKRGWLLMSGTLESSFGWYPELYTRWQAPNTEDAQSFSLPSWTNKVVYPGGRNDPEILLLEKTSSKEWFDERYGGIPSPPHGLVFPEFKVTVHTGVSQEYDFDPEQGVYLWVDPGYAHFYAVEVIQKRGNEIYVVDEVYETGLTTSDIINVCQKKPWWTKVIGGAIDVAALQHQAMPAVAEIWKKEGGLVLRSQKIRIQDGIERFKTYLKVDPLTNRPGIHVNSKCTGLISELGGCPAKDGQTRVYKWRMDREGNVIGDVPEDKNCDAIKACCYGLVDLTGYSLAQRHAEIRFF